MATQLSTRGVTRGSLASSGNGVLRVFRGPRALSLLLWAIALSVGLSLVSVTAALAHDELVGVEGTVNQETERVDITLSFSNEINEISTETVVTDSNGDNIADGVPVVSGRDVIQRVLMPELDQTVTIAWRVVSSDGHAISDRTAFAVVDVSGEYQVELRDAPPLATAGGDAAESAEPSAGWTSTLLWVVLSLAALIVATGVFFMVLRKNQRTALHSHTPEGGEHSER